MERGSYIRVENDMEEVNSDDQLAGFQLTAFGGYNLASLTATIPGPAGSPYENDIFFVIIDIPDNYPFEAPNFTFATHICHPNICNSTGMICSNNLTLEWSPTSTLKGVLLFIHQLLLSPDYDNPQRAQNSNVAEQTQVHANPLETEENVMILLEMGFEESMVLSSLTAADGDLDRAVSLLLPSDPENPQPAQNSNVAEQGIESNGIAHVDA